MQLSCFNPCFKKNCSVSEETATDYCFLLDSAVEYRSMEPTKSFVCGNSVPYIKLCNTDDNDN